MKSGLFLANGRARVNNIFTLLFNNLRINAAPFADHVRDPSAEAAVVNDLARRPVAAEVHDSAHWKLRFRGAARV